MSTNNKKEMTDRLPIRFLSHLSQLTSLLKGSGALTVVNSDALIRRHRSCFGGEVFDFSIRMATLILLNSRVKFRRSVIGPCPHVRIFRMEPELASLFVDRSCVQPPPIAVH